MTKTDDGFCCSFNTVSVQSTFAREETSTIDYESEEWVFRIFWPFSPTFKMLGMQVTTMMNTLSPLPPSMTMDMGMTMDRKGQEVTKEGLVTRWVREVRAKI